MVGSTRAAVGVAVRRRAWTPAELVDDLLGRDPGGAWSVRAQGMWRLARPVDRPLRAQGWKLHLSATPLSFVDVLARAVPVLVAERCAFKFAAGAGAVEWLNSRRCPRGTAGKNLTVYPGDDDQFRRLAELLDRATAGLAGPEILSDRRFRTGSLVHYRFGGFRPAAALDDDGCYRPMIVAPDGQPVDDRRDAWFAPPAWAPPPWPATLPGPREPVGAGARAVLLADRFVVLGAMRHTSRGGVFRAHDRETGATVVVKQARAHMEVDPAGRDCRDRLRHEADLYHRLAPTGLVPRLVATFTEGDDFFLVRELVGGTTLRSWVTGQAPAGGVPPDAGAAMVAGLVELVAAVHRAGLALVDVSPNNIVVDPGGQPRLIDPDNAAEVGRLVHPVGTPGYTPPEHQRHGLVMARPEADLFGLGGLVFLVAVGTDPVLAPDDPPERPARDRLRAWLAEAAPELPPARRLAPLVLGLTHPDPARRWSLARARHHLTRPVVRAGRPSPGPEPDRLVEDAVGWLRATMTPAGERLWPAGRTGATADPCAVQHGAAGVLAALVAATPHLADPAPAREAVEAACRWIERRLPAEPRLLPGLWFGRSGTAWALHDAARLLGDEQRTGRALDLAARVPVRWPSPDVAHGVAGAGLAQLHLASATGDPRFLPRARTAADALVAAAQRDGGHVCWPIPATLHSLLAGQTHLGHAHGVAGIGGFLLAAGAATGDGRYLGLAAEAAATLADTAVRDGATAAWPVRPGGPATTGAGWCAGAAGIGAFLLRAGDAFADPRLSELAGAAAATVRRDRPRANPAACHGLAGSGHFLLDLADARDDPAARRGAEDLARLLAVRATRRGGRFLVPDETGAAVAADHGVGLAGALGFLVRLRHGGPAPWTVRNHPHHRRDPS